MSFTWGKQKAESFVASDYSWIGAGSIRQSSIGVFRHKNESGIDVFVKAIWESYAHFYAPIVLTKPVRLFTSVKKQGARTTNFVDGVAHERVRLTKIDVRIFLRQLVLSLGQRTHTFQDDCFMVSQQCRTVVCENSVLKSLFVYSVLVYSAFIYSGLFPIFNVWTGEVFWLFRKNLSLNLKKPPSKKAVFEWFSDGTY